MEHYTRHIHYPRVGVGVIVLDSDNRILLGKRKNAHGAGDWAPPGGHLEFGETPVVCATRELAEETGLALAHARDMGFANSIFHADAKHYVTIFVQGTAVGRPRLLEPDKCAGWDWFHCEHLPSPLFLPFDTFVQKGMLRALYVGL